MPSPIWNETAVCTHICNLGFDSIKETFDILSLQDLVAVGEVCKHLQQAAGQYLHDNFLEKFHFENETIYSNSLGESAVEIKCFSQFIRRITVKDGDLRIFRTKHFEALTEIDFNNCKLRYISSIRHFLPQLETLRFTFSKIYKDFDENFLKFSTKLKRLCLQDYDDLHNKQRIMLMGTSNDWLQNHYRTIKHFELNSRRKCDEIIEFLKKNPNIRKFSTTMDFLIENRENLLTSKIELNVLAILHANTFTQKKMFDQFVKQLLEHKRKRFFQRLHLYPSFTIDENIYPPELLRFVTKLHRNIEYRQFNLSSLINLEELAIFEISHIDDIDVSLRRLTKLNFIHLVKGTISNILPFIWQLPAIRKICIDSIKNGDHFNSKSNVVDLSALNRGREQLRNATKLTIYVKEMVYLATTLAFKQKQFDFIEIKRHNSIEETHDFQ